VSDAGGFGDPPNELLQAGASEFTGLVRFIWDTTWLIDATLEALFELDMLDRGIHQTIPDLRVQVPERSLEVIGQILGGEHADALRRHGLADGDPEWAFKSAIFASGLRDAQETLAERDPTSDTHQRWIRRFLRRARHPLRAANVILRSVASALPGGGAFNEIKDGVESLVEEVLDEQA
jgi:hypothetical protein